MAYYEYLVIFRKCSVIESSHLIKPEDTQNYIVFQRSLFLKIFKFHTNSLKIRLGKLGLFVTLGEELQANNIPGW